MLQKLICWHETILANWVVFVPNFKKSILKLIQLSKINLIIYHILHQLFSLWFYYLILWWHISNNCFCFVWDSVFYKAVEFIWKYFSRWFLVYDTWFIVIVGPMSIEVESILGCNISVEWMKILWFVVVYFILELHSTSSDWSFLLHISENIMGCIQSPIIETLNFLMIFCSHRFLFFHLFICFQFFFIF